MTQVFHSLELIRRDSCVLCGSNSLISYKNLTKFPIYMGVTDQPIGNDIYIDQKWAVWRN